MASSQAGGGAGGGRKVAIVTGGASGIGLSMTKYFASEGYAVVIFDVNSASGASVAESVAAESPKATVSFKQTDVSSWETLSATFEEVYKEQGRIDVVMANAGISEQGSSSLVTLGEEKPSKPNLKVLDVNLFGAIYSVKLAVHYIQKNEVDSATNSRGLIVVTSSNAGLYPLPVAPMYSASKFGVIGLVRSLALPLERVKIRVNALAPAVLETNIAPSKSLFADMILTPMSTLVNGVRKFVENPSLSGEVAEIHGDNVTLRPPHEVVDEDSQKNLDNFWALGFA